MKKIIFGIFVFFSMIMYADLVDDGLEAAKKGNYKKLKSYGKDHVILKFLKDVTV